MSKFGGVVQWVRSLDRTVADLLLALIVTASSVLQVRVGAIGEDIRDPDLVSYGLVILGSVPLVWRRRAPVPVLVATSTVFAMAALLAIPVGQFLPPLIAVYTVAANCGRRTSVWALVLAGGFFTLLSGAGTLLAPESVPRDAPLQTLLYFAASWILGDNLRTRRAYMRELEDRAVRLEQAREADTRAAAAAERTRIARELHDVVAHHVSVIAVQAGAARRVAVDRPESAREALSSIETTARQAGTELRSLLGVLRKGEDANPGPLSPQPGLDELEQLVQQARAAGLAAELKVEGTPRELPAAVQLSAYRIVQESLTNTIKHARASNARVLVRYTASDLELEITDDGRGLVDPSELATGGHGLVGMRERAGLFGGDLTVGPRWGGGLKVQARLPLEAPARPGPAARDQATGREPGRPASRMEA